MEHENDIIVRFITMKTFLSLLLTLAPLYRCGVINVQIIVFLVFREILNVCDVKNNMQLLMEHA